MDTYKNHFEYVFRLTMNENHINVTIKMWKKEEKYLKIIFYSQIYRISLLIPLSICFLKISTIDFFAILFSKLHQPYNTSWFLFSFNIRKSISFFSNQQLCKYKVVFVLWFLAGKIFYTINTIGYRMETKKDICQMANDPNIIGSNGIF